MKRVTSALVAFILTAVNGEAQPVTIVAAGAVHSLFIKGDGSLWDMGNNRYGQLGAGTYNFTYPYGNNLPVMVLASNVTTIAGGGFHSVFRLRDGSVRVMGGNQYGQLGDGTTNNCNVPETIMPGGVTAIAAGLGHTLIVKNDGSLWAMGWNQYGQLGDGTTNNARLPVMILPGNVAAVAAGYAHSLILMQDGSLRTMGWNANGQLGDGSYSNRLTPHQIVSSNVTAIAAGAFFSLFLKADGSLWATGDNAGGQFGDGTYNGTNQPEKIVSIQVKTITAGNYHTLYLKDDGSLWAMGWNADGQLGNDSYDYTGVDRPQQILSGGVTAIAGGGAHSLFVKNDGSLWATGEDYDGQLGDGAYHQGQLIPELIVPGPLGYNLLAVQLLGRGDVRLSFLGVGETHYALDRSSTLFPASWVPLITNLADASGLIWFTNSTDPVPANSFWRVRSVP